MADFELNVKVNGVEQSVSTIGELEKALAATNQQLSQVEENSKEFKFLQNQAQNLEKVLVAVSGDAQQLDKSLKGVNQTTKTLSQTFTTTAQAANSIDGTKVKEVSTGVKEATGSAQSLRNELRQIVQELQQLEPGSARFQELSVRAGELRDQIGDTNSVVNALAGSTTERLGRALSSTAQLGIAGFQGIAAAQALFGSESEEINQTLVKLTALLNLSQALETFGGLGDKITQITAGFKSLFPAAASAATATGAAATATAAEGVAATGAAGATSAFAVALNALPLVAIVTALGLLVAGLINYAAGSDEAAKAEEERKKKLEEEKAAIDAVVSAQAKEGTSLVTLLARLKSTNAGTKERKELIDEINTNYGVGLKNLQDEKAFQDQATTALKNYIAQLKNKVALQLVEDEITKLLEKQIANQRELDALQGKVNYNTILYNKNLGAQFTLQDNLLKQNGIYLDGLQSQVDFNRSLQISENLKSEAAINSANTRITQINKENAALQKQIEDLGTQAQNYATLLDGAFEKLTTTSGKTNKTLDELKQKQEEVYANLRDFANQANEAEVQLARERVQRTKSRIDDLEFERDIALSTIIQEYETQKKAIEDNIKDKNKQKIALETLETNFQRQVVIENTRTFEKIAQSRVEDLKKAKEFYAELALASKILQDEITFGNNNVGDSLAALDQRLRQIEIDRLTRELENFTFINAEYVKKQNERLALQQIYNEEQAKIDRKQAETEAQFQISEIVKYYKSLEKFNIDYNEATGQYTVKATEAYLKEQEDANKSSLKAQLDSKLITQAQYDEQLLQLNAETNKRIEDEAIATEVVINQSAINLNREANVKKAEADANYNKTKVDNAKKTDQEILDSIQKTVDEINRLFSLVGSTILGVFQAISEGNQIELEQQLQATQNYYDERLSTLNESYNNELAALQANRNNGLLTEEQYNSAVSNLEKTRVTNTQQIETNLSASLRKQRQEAFDKEKKLKIAQATIAGIQGALTAFTSAFQLGPIAGPIVGGILAALVAATTGIQIANIKKTNLESPGVAVTAPNTGGAEATAGNAASAALTSVGGGFTTFNENLTGSPTGTATSGMFTSTPAQRVYVVESDITSAQNRVKVLEENASFG
jgi:hypothetical protein